jgi:ABC-type multidrug transport system fused ATPase/permease subunit
MVSRMVVNPEYRSGVKIKEICALAEKAHKELGVETREMRATKEALEGLGPLLKHVNKEHGSAWSKLFSILLRDKAQITVVFVISVLCGLPSALTTKLQTTAAQMSITGKESLFASAILGIVVTAFVDILVQTGAKVPREMISIKFKANLKEEVFKAVMRQDTEYFDKFSSAEILQRINEDTNTFADQAMTLPFDILQNASLAACNFVAMYTMVPRQLFMVAMPLIICAGFLKYKILTVVVRQLMNAGNVRRVTDTRVGELLSAKALQTIRSFGKESEEVSRNRRDLSRCAELDMAAQKKLQAFFSVFVPLDSGLGCIILGVGGRLVKQGILDPIALNQTIGMMLLLGFRVFIILDMYSKLGTAMEPAARISELLNARNKLETATWCEQPETERTTFRPNADECTALITCGEEPNGDIRGEIEFKEVDFYYPTRPEIKVLDKLSWKCAQGDHIAFCVSHRFLASALVANFLTDRSL